MKNKTVIIIAGPTASGKTAVAMELAKHFHTSIISADSRQCFRELDIGVARPSPGQLRQVPHFFIGTHSIHDTVNASLFEQLALGWADELFKEKDTLVMTGGTGLYIKAFCEGLDDIPPVDEAIRETIRQGYAQNGMEWLQEEIRKQDPLFYARGEILNPHRLMRALEVKQSTGNSILSYRNNSPAQRPFRIIKIGLELPKVQLHRNIDMRTEGMMEAGLLQEAEQLLPYRHLNALRTVGYTELFSYFDGSISLPEATDLIKKNTRQYAKRQMTWFRKDPAIRWMKPGEVVEWMTDDRWPMTAFNL